MSYQYSQKLIEETIKCFKEENGLDISSEQANEYLNSLANLYLAFTGRAVSAERLSAGRDEYRGSLDLISPHNCYE